MTIESMTIATGIVAHPVSSERAILDEWERLELQLATLRAKRDEVNDAIKTSVERQAKLRRLVRVIDPERLAK